MFSKSKLLAGVAGGLTHFLLGYIVYGLLMRDFFAANLINADIYRAEGSEEMLFIALGALAQGFFMATIYSKWARGIHSARHGVEFGALIGAFVGIGIGLLNYGVMNGLGKKGTLVDAIVAIVFFAIVGLVISVVYKATAPKDKEA